MRVGGSEGGVDAQARAQPRTPCGTEWSHRRRDHPRVTATVRSGADAPCRGRDHPRLAPPPTRSPETTISSTVGSTQAKQAWVGGASRGSQSVRQPSKTRPPRHQPRPPQRQLRSSRHERPGAGGPPAHAVNPAYNPTAHAKRRAAPSPQHTAPPGPPPSTRRRPTAGGCRRGRLSSPAPTGCPGAGA